MWEMDTQVGTGQWGMSWRCDQGGAQGGTQAQGGAEPGVGLGGFMEEGLAERRTGAGARECVCECVRVCMHV